MSDKEFIEYANKYIKDHNITSRGQLKKSDSSLYETLRKRNLLDKIDLKPKYIYHHYHKMSDKELIEYANKYIKEHNITSRTQLQKSNRSLYKALRKRNLLDRLGLEPQRTYYHKMSDNEFIEYVSNYIKEHNITSRAQLFNSKPSLYQALMRRNLLDKVDLPKRKRSKRCALSGKSFK